MVYAHVCKSAHLACSAGNSAIENVCFIINVIFKLLNEMVIKVQIT